MIEWLIVYRYYRNPRQILGYAYKLREYGRQHGTKTARFRYLRYG